MKTIRHPNSAQLLSGFLTLAMLFFIPSCDSKGKNIDKILQIDELAADPDDPERMTEGVAFRDIIPKPAISAGLEAVKKYKRVPRFHYQLDRAYQAAEDFEDAFQSYSKASKLGHAQAKTRLAEFYGKGIGVQKDLEKTRTLLLESQEMGCKQSVSTYNMFFFRPVGFSNPADFEAIYTGKFDEVDSSRGQMLVYLFSFVETIQKYEECPQVLSNEGSLTLAQQGYVSALGGVFGGFLSGGNFTGTVHNSMKADDDAHLFWQRYRADSPVAKNMFSQMDKYILEAEGVSLLEIAEEEFYRNRGR